MGKICRQADSGGSEFALTRVGKIADGWMTHSVSPEGFRNSWLVLHGRASMVLGVSPDDRVTHRDFATREELPFLLVADEDRKIARAFGVPAEGAPRIAAFVVGKDGKIVRAFSDPDPATLATQVIEALGGT